VLALLLLRASLAPFYGDRVVVSEEEVAVSRRGNIPIYHDRVTSACRLSTQPVLVLLLSVPAPRRLPHRLPPQKTFGFLCSPLPHCEKPRRWPTGYPSPAKG
jgi:hypothetical protein